ncbi:SDR family NAD(P)-dependent oxidoreductase [bacterium]|nr:SDR family NAD(P)-dependent oxidoreductase [bacterium]
MDHDATTTALVTGATSGLGLEAAAQLADLGPSRVIITGRTGAKVEAARDQLAARTGKDVFETLVLDNDDLATVEKAVAHLESSGTSIDRLILNAGIAPTKEILMTVDGLEATVSSSLIGHHVFTMGLLRFGLLSDGARIVIAGSEAARGDVPTFNTVDMHAMATNHFDGDLEAAVDAQIHMAPPATYKPGDVYATAKMFVAWWSAELARRLPAGTTVNTVSPGSTPGTDAARNAPFFMRRLLMPIFKLMPGMSHSVADGAGRYIEATTFGDDVSGRFFASPLKKMTGPLTEIHLDHIDDDAGSAALWSTVARVSRVDYPASV